MTDDRAAGAEATSALDQVQQAAADRARRAGVAVRDLTAADMPAAADVLTRIWRSDGRFEPMEAPLLVALAFAGNYCAGAFDGDRVVGVCVGFFAAPADHTVPVQALHSHIAGVESAFLGRGIGAAVKLHQRAWAAQRGLTEITWTFDPLAARNAWFNLGVLRARATRYLPDFYGEMHDGLNAGQGSDRLLIRWPVAPGDDQSQRPAFGLDDDTFRVLAADSASEPIRGGTVPGRYTRASIAVPHRIEELRERNPVLGRRWRAAVRRSFSELLDGGWEIAGFDRAGAYLFERPAPPSADASDAPDTGSTPA